MGDTNYLLTGMILQVGAPWDGGPLMINPIYTLYHVGIYWGPYPLLKGSNKGVKQLGAPILRVPGFSLWNLHGKEKVWCWY